MVYRYLQHWPDGTTTTVVVNDPRTNKTEMQSLADILAFEEKNGQPKPQNVSLLEREE